MLWYLREPDDPADEGERGEQPSQPPSDGSSSFELIPGRRNRFTGQFEPITAEDRRQLRLFEDRWHDSN